MAELSPEDSPPLAEHQSSSSHPHVKVKLKRSSASWEVQIDEEETVNATVTCEKGVSKQQTIFTDYASEKVDEANIETCSTSSLQYDSTSQQICSGNITTAVDCQNFPSHAKDGDLQHRCDPEVCEISLVPNEKPTLMQEPLSTECRNVRPSCPETLTQEKPRTEDKCTEGRNVRPSCPETLTQEGPRTEDKCTEGRNVRPSCPETLTQEGPRTEDKCIEGSGNEPPRLDGVRERCRQLLVQALETGTHNVQLVKDLATSLEDHIFCEFKNTGTKYKNRVRSRAANLKDPRNPELRRRLIQGEITPQQMATMSAQEMASDEVKKFRRQVSEESIQRRQVPHADGTMTDMFKCENCGRENCCYNQYRGFSADGPIASPFVFCMDCGNRWKFF